MLQSVIPCRLELLPCVKGSVTEYQCWLGAVFHVDWLGVGREEWDARMRAAPGSSGVPSLLRRHGLPARLAEALAEELGLSERSGHLRSNPVLPRAHGFCCAQAVALPCRGMQAGLHAWIAPVMRQLLPLRPLRCASSWCEASSRRLAELRKGERAALLTALVEYALPATGHEGYAKVNYLLLVIACSAYLQADAAARPTAMRAGRRLCAEEAQLRDGGEVALTHACRRR